MPQYTCTWCQHDDYWKLDSYDDFDQYQLKELLTSRGKIFGNRAKSDTLRAQLRRMDLGHMAYARFNNGELRTFLRSRKIDASAVIQGRRRGPRAALIRLLTEADLEGTFDNFQKLPTDVRLLVYMHHLRGGFRQDLLYAPSQPPIARVSRLLRYEALPEFYKQCTFVLPCNRQWGHLASRPVEFGVPSQLVAFLRSGLGDWVEYVQHVQICVMQLYTDTGEKDWADRADFSMRLDMTQTAVSRMINFPVISSWYWIPDNLRNRISTIAQGILREGEGADGRKKLKTEDFFKLRRAMELAWMDH